MALRLEYDGKKIEIRFGHKEVLDIADDDQWRRFLNKEKFIGGRRCSVAELYIDGTSFSVGLAVCNPRDNFSKVMGRKIALTDAIKPLDRLTRRAIWNQYKQFMKI